ncbi:AmmeMemoRadiSam system protein A [Sulfurospirillum barnesii]|uniref:Uncharacterized protein, PH0010 family n=1 Tax=Sulfurospirillum barnesii (strain ATCC 700032 / DSM 10660 / SES-3) TaxID=760154 RepID=I3XTV6_SULBS|nr:AmmeMemoRadiSam system protein A [Sulfurospirillum barnesii]AFL67380.1 uncharacterized protein, PH0010 family [Sulfurospirillum barnesii SES-3]
MKEIILTIAKQAIYDGLNYTSTLDKESLLERFPQLSNPKATFVTLSLYGELRGCIGSLIAHRSLLDDIIYNAKAAAFDDARFHPLNSEEFLHVKIEVSLLSTPEIIEYSTIDDLKSKIIIGEDGIILEKNGKKATFLPKVWEELPSFEHFFSHLCQKAGLDALCLEKHPNIWRYKVEKVE